MTDTSTSVDLYWIFSTTTWKQQVGKEDSLYEWGINGETCRIVTFKPGTGSVNTVYALGKHAWYLTDAGGNFHFQLHIPPLSLPSKVLSTWLYILSAIFTRIANTFVCTKLWMYFPGNKDLLYWNLKRNVVICICTHVCMCTITWFLTICGSHHGSLFLCCLLPSHLAVLLSMDLD